MPIETSDLGSAVAGFLLDNWTATPLCFTGSKGFDLSGQHTQNLYDVSVDFIEFEFNGTARKPAGVSRDSGIQALGFLDIQIYTELGLGNMKLAEIEQQLFKLLERKTIATAQVRAALSVGKPYEFRGKLTKMVSFPFEYFSKS